MQLNHRDPNAEPPAVARQRFRGAMNTVLALVALLWAILLVDQLLPGELRRFGAQPGELSGLLGLVTMPLLHGGFVHLITNTLPLIMLGVALLYFYSETAWKVIPWFWLVPGLFVWFVGAEGSNHVGASGLTFALLGYVGLGGLLRRDAAMLAVSLATLFYYGGMLSGVLPIEPGVSWEAHLGGVLTGLVLAIWYRRADIPPRRRYDYEDEDEDEDEEEESGRAFGDDFIEGSLAPSGLLTEDEDRTRPPTIH